MDLYPQTLALPTDGHQLRKRWSPCTHSPFSGSITTPPPAQTSNSPGRCPRKAAWPGPPSSCCFQNSPPLLLPLDDLGWMRGGAGERLGCLRLTMTPQPPNALMARAAPNPSWGTPDSTSLPELSNPHSLGSHCFSAGPPGNPSGQPVIF